MGKPIKFRSLVQPVPYEDKTGKITAFKGGVYWKIEKPKQKNKK